MPPTRKIGKKSTGRSLQNDLFSLEMYLFEIGFEESGCFSLSMQIFSSFALWNVPFMKNLTFFSFFDLQNRRFFASIAIPEAFRTIFNHPCHRSL